MNVKVKEWLQLTKGERLVALEFRVYLQERGVK